MEDAAVPTAIDLVTGWWKSQVLHAATSLGVFDAISDTEARPAEEVASELNVDGPLLYRLLRALASFDVLEEDAANRFRTTAVGTLFRSSHPTALREMVLLEDGPVHTAAWRHLPDMIRDGKGTAFEREFDRPYWDHLKADPNFASVFSEAMSSYSAHEGLPIQQALQDEPFGSSVLCDVGGSYGVLLAEVLRNWPDARGIVLDLPEVVATARHSKLPVDTAQRIEFVGGDMFERVPEADVYFLKHILHDWADAECVNILSVICRAAKPTSRLFLCEFVVPGPREPHFAKLFDIHMMVMLGSQQRTADELAGLLAQAGWQSGRLLPLDKSPMSVLEAKMA